MRIFDDYNVILMPFSGDIRACVRIDGNGYPTVYINDYLCPSAKRKALLHELRHFERGDFFSHLTICEIENDTTNTVTMKTMALDLLHGVS